MIIVIHTVLMAISGVIAYLLCLAMLDIVFHSKEEEPENNMKQYMKSTTMYNDLGEEDQK